MCSWYGAHTTTLRLNEKYFLWWEICIKIKRSLLSIKQIQGFHWDWQDLEICDEIREATWEQCLTDWEHLFITLTQNDASPDLQTIAREDSPGSQASRHHHLTQPIRLSGRPFLDILVKSILRMDQYLLKFKRLFIYNKENNPFGRRFLLFYKSRVPEAWCNPLQYSSLVEW